MEAYLKPKRYINMHLLKQIVLFALPIMAMNILQLLFNAADMIIVGRYSGSHALAAVGATGSLINLLVNLFMGLSVGISVVVARDYGAHRDDDINRSLHTSIAVGIFSGVFVMIVGILFCKPLLAMMGTPVDIIDASALYMRIYFLGIPATMVYNFGAGALRATGDSKRPMYFLTIAGIVNVVLNMFFVVVLGMSVDGVALATTISQYLSAFLVLFTFSKEAGALHFSTKKIKIHKQKLVDIVRIGIPAGLQSTLFSVSNVLIQSAINSFGSTAVAASAAAANIEGIVSTSTTALYNSAITFTGQSMGARDYDRIDETAKVVTVLIFASWILIGGLTVVFGRPLLSIYTTDSEVVELGLMRIRIMMVAYFTAGAMNVYPGLTRAMGYSISPMLSTLFGAVLMRIAWLLTIFKQYPTQAVLFAAYPVTWAISGLGQVLIFFYARKRVREKDRLQEAHDAEATEETLAAE
jgi:putative MATE family efflux protein